MRSTFGPASLRLFFAGKASSTHHQRVDCGSHAGREPDKERGVRSGVQKARVDEWSSSAEITLKCSKF